MKRHTRGSAFDISIHHDELEQSRRQLEQKLKSSISVPLPIASDEDEDEDDFHFRRHHDSSVEYPRHDSGAIPYPDFPSFAHRSGEFVEADSQMHGWSYRTADDDEGVSPYGGETMSTAAHHASALTITAGLGGRGARRDISMSGAEYDPERPLNQIMAGVGRLSMFDDSSKSKNNVTSFEPLVVDSTAELDRILQSGYAPQLSISRSVHPTPPMSNASSSSSDSEVNVGSPSRSKLTDHLRNVAFSPKRPRNGQLPRIASSPAHQPQPNFGSPLPKKREGAANVSVGNLSANMATPRPAKRLVSAPIKGGVAQPEVRLQPPTPSSASSKFTRMARGIAKDIEEEAKRPAHNQRKASHESPRKDTRTATRRSSIKENSKSRIVLPDVTGLTMAVESPAKFTNEYHPYRVNGAPRESEARLLQTLNTVQSKLHQLNEENTISRRRVHELEMELDECKRDVARERTRLLDREEVIVQQQKDLLQAVGKAKGKAKVASQDQEEVTKRYKEAVEEKKALEALINGLRTHLTRLTSELASHQELLVELRDLRDADSRTLREKGAEITRLNEEVERLAGEIEVLRGVVEEGLRERRANKEVSMQQSEADVAMSRDLDEEEGEEEEEEVQPAVQKPNPRKAQVEDEEDLEGFESSAESSQPRIIDRTMRTDHATLGSSGFGQSTSTPHRVQFVDQRQLEEISAEVEERRSNHSGSRPVEFSFRSRSPSPIRANRSESFDMESDRSRSPSPMPGRRLGGNRRKVPERPRTPVIPDSPPPRPHAPEPLTPALDPSISASKAEQRERREAKRKSSPEQETPFPQIRGERLERLFFSAPEHNPKTCTVCYRRRHRDDPQRSPSWVPPKRGASSKNPANEVDESEDEEDEGFAEGPDDVNDGGRTRLGPFGGKGQVQASTDPNVYRKAAHKAGLPPQTVVMRVVRDLEDDFTHYKSVYVELADQYKDMDPVSDVPRRNMLARHLREVVDILEQKGDQIASLYELLSFKDKPTAASAVPSTRALST